MAYVLPRKGDGVWDAERLPPYDQPNGKVIEVDLANERVWVKFYAAWEGPKEYEKCYDLDAFIGCWDDSFNQFHLNT